jgi:DNA invertase Pin-like site-specific DNA recombinase
MLLLYQRVSTTEQAGEGRTSLEDQERIGRGFAMAKGFAQFDVACYCDAGVSATIPLRNRPAGKELLEVAKAGDTVFASKLDRMFRSAQDALNMSEIFLEKKINLVLFDLGSDPINASGISQFFLTVISAVAQLERTMIRERMTSGKKAKKAKGGHIGGKTPYGFRVVGSGREARLEMVEDEQRVIEAVRELMLDRPYLPVGFTTRELRERGMMSRSGKPFWPQQVSRIMEQVKASAH